MSKRNSGPRLGGAKSGAGTLAASLLCILIGLAIGFLVLLILAWISAAQGTGAYTFQSLLKTTWSTGFLPILTGGFYSTANIHGMGVRAELIQAAPLIMTGLSVGFAFKTGLFNIGAAGQYTLGAFGALYCALVLKLPWWACLLAATLFGAIWGAIPGIFKAFLNVNEVITSIMFNWIGLYAVNTMIYAGGAGVMYNAKQTKTYELLQVSPGSLIPSFNVKVGGEDYFMKNSAPTIAIFIAIAVAVVIWVVINKTTFGYELKACGHNKDAARYAGINEKKNIVLSMLIAGALAGFGAGLFYLSGTKQWEPLNSNALPAAGFNGISVALLAASNPLGAIFSGLFITHITLGGGFMAAKIFPSEVADIISGVVIYLCAFSLLFKSGILRLFSRKRKAVSAGPQPGPDPADDQGKEGDA